MFNFWYHLQINKHLLGIFCYHKKIISNKQKELSEGNFLNSKIS